MREIKLEYDIYNKDKVSVSISDLENRCILHKRMLIAIPTKESNEENYVELYNKLLEEYDCDEDDELADLIDVLANDIIVKRDEQYDL